MISIVDAFENNIGVELTSKNAADLRKLSDDQVVKLTDGCLEFMTQFSETFETSIGSSMSNPCAYLHSDYTKLYHAVGGLVTTTTRLDLISRFLLYYPSIAINDSFLIKYWNIPEMREYLALYFTNLASLSPLVKKGIVNLVPNLPAEDDHGVKQQTRSIVKELRKIHDTEEQDEEMSEFILRHFAYEFTLSSYFDSFLPYSTESSLLHQVLKRASVLPTIDKEMEATVVAKVLHDIQLPKLEELSVNDILAIRENDETFGRWRAKLQHVLMQQHLLGTSGREPSAQEFQLLAEPILKEEAAQLREGIRAKHSIRYMRDSFVGFSVTAVSTFVSSGIAGIDWKKLAAGSVTGLLHALIFKRSSKTDKAMLKHYSLFEGIANQENKTD